MKLSQLEALDPSHSWENLTTNTCTLHDLDKTRIKQVVHAAVAEGRLTGLAAKASMREILEKFELLVAGRLTNAAVVLFCKTEYKQFIQSSLMLARFEGLTKSVFLDNKSLRGNIFDLYENATKFLNFNLPMAGEVVEGSPFRVNTPAVPYKVLREAIINALVHRDYAMRGGSIDIAIYDDRVEIDSPGKLPHGIKLHDLTQKHKSIRRNPLIANILYICGLIEGWGRGTLEMIALCKQSGNPTPRFEESAGSFSVTLPLKEPLRQFTRSTSNQTITMPDQPALSARQKEVIKILAQGPMNREQIMKKMKKPPTIRTVQFDISKLKKLGYISQRDSKLGRFVVWALKS